MNISPETYREELRTLVQTLADELDATWREFCTALVHGPAEDRRKKTDAFLNVLGNAANRIQLHHVRPVPEEYDSSLPESVNAEFWKELRAFDEMARSCIGEEGEFLINKFIPLFLREKTAASQLREISKLI